jgi:hypothetical protein
MLLASFLAYRDCPFCARPSGTRETNASHAGRTLPALCDRCRDELTRKVQRANARFWIDTEKTN